MRVRGEVLMVLVMLGGSPAWSDDFVDRWADDGVAAADFAERWPATEHPGLVPILARHHAARHRDLHQHRAHRRHRRGFVCHRQTFYRGDHRFWRCRRS